MVHAHGTVLREPIDRFADKIALADSGCILWIGGIQGEGYGQFFAGWSYRTKSGKVPAHRWSYEYHVGPIPEGLQIDHLCRERRCINPEHLEAVTPQENIDRSLGNGSKTECPAGHSYTPENTYVTPQGARTCRACKGFNGRGIDWRGSLTECKHGHLFNASNTYIRPNGNRSCRTCRTEAKRRYLARKKDA